jgi:hypothetical protein
LFKIEPKKKPKKKKIQKEMLGNKFQIFDITNWKGVKIVFKRSSGKWDVATVQNTLPVYLLDNYAKIISATESFEHDKIKNIYFSVKSDTDQAQKLVQMTEIVHACQTNHEVQKLYNGKPFLFEINVPVQTSMNYGDQNTNEKNNAQTFVKGINNFLTSKIKDAEKPDNEKLTANEWYRLFYLSPNELNAYEKLSFSDFADKYDNLVYENVIQSNILHGFKGQKDLDDRANKGPFDRRQLVEKYYKEKNKTEQQNNEKKATKPDSQIEKFQVASILNWQGIKIVFKRTNGTWDTATLTDEVPLYLIRNDQFTMISDEIKDDVKLVHLYVKSDLENAFKLVSLDRVVQWCQNDENAQKVYEQNPFLFEINLPLQVKYTTTVLDSLENTKDLIKNLNTFLQTNVDRVEKLDDDKLTVREWYRLFYLHDIKTNSYPELYLDIFTSTNKISFAKYNQDYHKIFSNGDTITRLTETKKEQVKKPFNANNIFKAIMEAKTNNGPFDRSSLVVKYKKEKQEQISLVFDLNQIRLYEPMKATIGSKFSSLKELQSNSSYIVYDLDTKKKIGTFNPS